MRTVGVHVMSTEHSTTSAAGSAISPTVQTVAVPRLWDGEADVVVVGAGATGLPAAIVAREAGAARNALLRDALALGPDWSTCAPVARHGLHHGQRVDAPARGRCENGGGADTARTPHDRHPSGGARGRPRAGHPGEPSRHHA